MKNPKFTISPEDYKVELETSSKHTIGKLLIEKDNSYIFMTDFWNTPNYSVSGIWKNITYLDYNGKEKTGDLEICYNASQGQHIWFKEVEK